MTSPDIDDATAASGVVLRALQGEQLDAFDELVARMGPDALKDLGASEHGQAWARVPRHLLPHDDRLVVLHAAARVFRFDGDATHLDGDLFETIVRRLEAGDAPWAEQAARIWLGLVLHTGEAASIWPQARVLLDRFRDQLHDHPGLLGNVATLASTCGEPIADELWERTLAHPTLHLNAARRWEAELDWARCHLLLPAGEPLRAMKVIRRARKGFADLGTASAHLRWTDATLELVCGLAWLGRHDESLEIVEESLRRVEPGGELELWLRAAAAFPATALGDESAARDATSAMRRASTDTSIIQLRAVHPARILAAMHAGDVAALREAIHDACAIETSSPLDVEARLTWRVVALEAAAVLGDDLLRTQLLDELDIAFGELAFDVPVHRVRRDHVVSSTAPGQVDAAAVAAEAARRGISLPDLTPRDSGAPSTPAPRHELAVQLLGEFDVRIDGASVHDRAWSGRRQARVLLALLLVHRGQLEVREAAELLWGDVDERTARARLGPLFASIRAVLAEAGESSPARELLTRGGRIALRLHPHDRSDLEELREAAVRVRREPARSRDRAYAALAAATSRPVADLGSDRAAFELREAIHREVAQLVPGLAAAWDGMAAPGRVVHAVRAVFDADPTDADACARLMVLCRDRDDVPGASEAYHRLRTSLDETLGLAPPAWVVQLHASVIADGPEPAAVRQRA